MAIERLLGILARRVSLPGLLLLVVVLGLTAHSLLLLRYSLPSQRDQMRAIGFQREQIRTLDFSFLIERLQRQDRPDEYTRLLAWVASRVPEKATILILAGPNPDYGQYYHASYELVPRRVWLAGGVSSVPGPNWGIAMPTDRDSWRATIDRYGIGYLLLLDKVSPNDVSATGLDGIAWWEKYSTAYLAAVAAEKATQ